MRMKHPQPFSVQTQEICYDLTVKIQNDSMRLLDHTEERPNIENGGTREALYRDLTHPQCKFFDGNIYIWNAYKLHNTIKSCTHTHLSNRQLCLGDPD